MSKRLGQIPQKNTTCNLGFDLTHYVKNKKYMYNITCQSIEAQPKARWCLRPYHITN